MTDNRKGIGKASKESKYSSCCNGSISDLSALAIVRKSSGTSESILKTDNKLPPKPEEPDPSDCCGNGCVTCVLDIYQEELTKWEEECKRIKLGLPLVTPQAQVVHIKHSY